MKSYKMGKFNPSAFPLGYAGTEKEEGYHDGGMTLLDYFAAKAMQGICAHNDAWSIGAAETAEKSYQIALAMLKEREKVINGLD